MELFMNFIKLFINWIKDLFIILQLKEQYLIISYYQFKFLLFNSLIL